MMNECKDASFPARHSRVTGYGIYFSGCMVVITGMALSVKNISPSFNIYI